MTKYSTTTPLKALLGLATGTALLLTSAAMAAEDKFPSKPIQVVIHSSYGGGTDVTARMMMIRSRRNLKTDMQVIAKRGGSGAKAHAYAKSRAKDGYTLMAMTQTHLYTIARGKSSLTIDDVVGVARAMDDPTFITVSGKGNLRTLADLIRVSKTKALNWGVAQIGGTEHIGLATFAKAAGIKFKVVPFGSGAQMVQALLSGAIDATLPNVSEAGEQVRDGSFRALAVMSEKRLKDYPDVPTTFENGFKVKASTTRGYWVLKGTPMDRVKILSKGLVKAMKHKVFGNYLKSSGLSVEDSVAGHAVWDKQLKEEYATAVAALTELGIIKK
ncbi:MAG: tripartite tricarboxylate transporter substrate binding protein [Proteobacteria bacterium]|nr:tripartite tricarboxylate transporter substrate binding protein [Pseudomonadota bacterium]MDA1325664.1 tripartite tricarboxylate transporter substrate binding protein [Pseudomonadota bacterium]